MEGTSTGHRVYGHATCDGQTRPGFRGGGETGSHASFRGSWPARAVQVRVLPAAIQVYVPRPGTRTGRWGQSGSGPTSRVQYEGTAMSIEMKDIDNWFTHHPPTRDQIAQYTAIRSSARDLAITILGNTPPSADQTAAIRKVREAVMIANAAIACGGK
jgi:hypothetical protein